MIQQLQQKQEQTPDFDELLVKYRDGFKRKKNNNYGVIATMYKVLGITEDIDDDDNNNNGITRKQFLIMDDLSKDSVIRSRLPPKKREEFIKNAVKQGILDEVRFPERMRYGHGNKKDKVVDYIMKHGTGIRQDISVKRLRGMSYYTVTDKGKELYSDIKEMLQLLSSNGAEYF